MNKYVYAPAGPDSGRHAPAASNTLDYAAALKVSGLLRVWPFPGSLLISCQHIYMYMYRSSGINVGPPFIFESVWLSNGLYKTRTCRT